MEHLDIILPGLLVLIAFLLKLVVDRSVEIPNAIQAIIELPVDIVFLALTFSVAFTLTSIKNQANGLFYGFVGFAFAIIVVLLWKKTQKLFISGSKWWILLIFINLSLSGYAVIKSVELVISCENVKTECVTNTEKN
jgi:hypothetical protein